jgi:hypothetical protein
VDNTRLGKKAGKFLVDYSDPTKRDERRIEGNVREGGYYYHEGPEFRLEYIHDRVEY